MRARISLVALLTLTLSGVSAAPRVDWPVGSSTPRVTWDGRGELVLVGWVGLARYDLARATRTGPGRSWLPSTLGGCDERLRLEVQQRIGGLTIARTAIDDSAPYCRVVFCTSRAIGVEQARNALGNGQMNWSERGIAVVRDPADLPPNVTLLQRHRLLVVEHPGLAQAPALAGALRSFAEGGGRLVLAGAAASAVPPRGAVETMPGRPLLRREAAGFGWIVRCDGPLPLDREYWLRVALATGGQIAARSANGDAWEDVPRRLDPGRQIDGRPLLAWVVGYALLLLGGQALARRRGLRGRWLLSGAVAAAVTLAIVASDGGFTPATARATQLTVASAASGQRWASARVDLRLASGAAGSYAARLPGSVLNGGAGTRYDAPARRSMDETGRLAYWSWRLPPRAADQVAGRLKLDLGGAVVLRLRATRDGVAGDAWNQSPLHLRGAVLAWGESPRQTCRVGDLAPGRRLTINAVRLPHPTPMLTALLGLPDAVPPPPPPPPGATLPTGPPRATLYARVDALGPAVELTPAVHQHLHHRLVAIGATVVPGDNVPWTQTVACYSSARATLPDVPGRWEVGCFQADGPPRRWLRRAALAAPTTGLRVWRRDAQRFVAIPAGASADLTPYLTDSFVALAQPAAGADHASWPKLTVTYAAGPAEPQREIR